MVDWRGFRFSMRSDTITEGRVEFIDYYSGEYFAADFNASPAWTEIRIPFDRFVGEAGSLSAVVPDSDCFAIIISTEIPPEALRQGLESETFAFNVDIDDIGFF